MTDDSTQTDQTEIEKLQADFAKLQDELAVMTDAAKRTLADFQNYKRRAEEDRGEIQVFANMRLLQAIFPVIDNLARAFEAVPAELQNNEWLKGVQAIEKNLLSELEKLGLSVITEIGVQADPNKHEVVLQAPVHLGKFYRF